MAFTFTAQVAWDPIGKQAVKNVSFQVYAVADTGFVTPLPITDPYGVALPGNILNSGTMGVFPQFMQASNPAVVITDPAHTYVWTFNCVPTDAATAAFANDKTSSTSAAIRSLSSGVWQSNTAYTVGQAVINPTGDLVRCTTAHTSTASYDSTRFALNATDTNGATAPALSATYVSKGTEFLNLNVQPGVDMTGNTECGAAVQTAINLASTKGLILIGSGQIKSATGLSIVDNVDLTRVVLNYTGPSTTTALTVGNTGGIVRKDMKLPYVVNLNKVAGNTGWGGVGVAGTVGVSILNCGTCRITVQAVYSFETGLLVTGSTGRGSVYNTISLGEVVDNKVNVKFVAPGGYNNQNTFLGGRIAHSGSDTSFTAGTRHVLMANGLASEIAQGNTFVGSCFESPDFVEFQVECWGLNNQFLDCSWETNTNTSRVAWRGTAAGNQIIGGVQAPTLIVTADAGATANDIFTATVKTFSSAIKFTGPNYDIGGTAGAGVDQPRYLRVNTAVQTGYGTTHPAPATAGIGSYRYDTGKGKPVFTDGAAWYRADSYLKTTKTANYTILTTDVYDSYLFNGASLTATLPDPTAAAQDVRITIKNVAATALTVNSAGVTKTLDGAASQSLAQWAKATYISDGTQWLTV